MPDPRAETRLHWALVNGAHLTVLSAFALAQPLFDILGRNPEFFAVRGSTATQIVIFALVVLLALPAALIGVELAVSVVSRTVAQAVHLVFVSCLVAVVVLHVSTKTEALAGRAALVAAALLGVAGALLYWRVRAIRVFLTFLVPAPLVFLALFLVSSPVSKLVFVEDAAATTVAVQATTPVVVIVFDEFPTATLMDRTEGVDARRWPNFAALARDSTWFRSATTVYSHTSGAVPAILTGKLPKPGLLPIFADHPQNLFTFLGGSYELKVIEVLRLCPPSICQQAKSASFDPNASDESGSLASDVGVVYLHLLLPDPYASKLPPISNTWGNFGGRELAGDERTRSRGKPTKTFPPCSPTICKFASLIEAGREPTLHFLHVGLPHVSWRFLPSGKRYEGSVQSIPGDGADWTSDRWLTVQAEQRYLLQLGYTDRALGLILRRLRATGIYDRALVVVTADHGESFRPGMPRRNVEEGNLADIAFVPLFVKLPGQKQGRIDDSLARTVDILPTIAHALDTRLPWNVDGRSLVGASLAADGTVIVGNPKGRSVRASLSRLRVQRARELAQQHAVFGTGPIARVYRIGPHQELLGKNIARLDTRPSRGTGYELNGRELLEVVDLSTDLLPTYLTGHITGSHPPQQDLAIAVNGTIRAVTRSYTGLGTTKFQALVPEEALRAGANDVAVFAVGGSGAKLVLEELRRIDVMLTLENGAAPAIESSDGTTIRVKPRAVAGEVRIVWRDETGTFEGWAADLDARRAAERVVVFVDGRSAYVGRPGKSRKDIGARYGARRAGFVFRLPGSILPTPGGGHEVRVFAVLGGVASELRVLGENPWADG
jgi:hypothetical protein